MACAGARNQTETEMAKVLRFSLPQEEVHAAFGKLSAQMQKIEGRKRVTLAVANSLWCQQEHPFEDAFVTLVRERYDAEARQVDFRNSIETSRGEINDWVEQKTMGKVKDAIGTGQLTSDTRLVLCNAVYFKGKWQFQFKTENTAPMPFYLRTNQPVTVPMMWRESDFKMVDCDGGSVEVLELPYSGKDLSMIILLPTALPDKAGFEQFSLPDLESKFTVEQLQMWLKQLDQSSLSELSVGLPRFSFAQSFDLKRDLESLGMSSAFHGGADFSGMDSNSNLLLSGVIHRTFVEVNEEGTEAAAVTWAGSAAAAIPRRFMADHPFIFLIRENGSGTILFLGRVVDPTK